MIRARRLDCISAVVIFANRVVWLGGFVYAAIVAAEPLTIDRALELAERNHPQLRAAVAQREGAQFGITTARAYPNPETGVLVGHQRARVLGTVPGPVQVYSFSQPLETPSVRATRIQAAEQRQTSTTFALDETRLLIRASVRQAFYGALRRRAELEIARDNQRLVEDLRRRIQVQFNVGEAARLELTRSEAEVAIARTSTQSAELRLVSALATLRAAASLPPETDIDPRGTLSGTTGLPDLETLRRQAFENHPALRLASSEVRRAEVRLRNEIALRTPQPFLRSEYEHQPDVATYRVGIAVPVPVWNKREGPIGEATAAVRQAASEADLRRLELNTALENAYGRYQVATRQLALYQEGVLKQAEAALQAAEASYKFGERGILEVLDAQRVLRAARLDFLNAQYDRQAALIDLEQLRAAVFEEKKP